MYTKQTFIKDIEELIVLCQTELEKRKQGIVGDFSVKQLEDYVIPELKTLLKQTQLNSLPVKEKRRLGSASLLVDCWVMKKSPPMSVKLFALADNYRNNLE